MKTRLFLITIFLLGSVNNAICEETAKTPSKTVRITISPETTFITEPLLPDGRVDYFGAINRQLSEGVTPENNIFAGIFSLIAGEWEYSIIRAIFEGEESGSYIELQTFREKYSRLLGLDAPPDLNSLHTFSPPGVFEPDGVDPYQELLKFYPKEEIDAKLEERKKEEAENYRNQHKEGQLDDENLAEKIAFLDSQQFRNRECRSMINYELYYVAQTRIFNEKECPLIAAWMKDSTVLAEQLIEISKRPKSYNPQVRENDVQSIYESTIPYMQSIRQMARYFEARGNWHFGRGEYDEAFECAFASLRLGTTLRSNAGFIVEELVGVAIQGIGHYDIVNYLGHLENKKDAAWLLTKQKEYREIREGDKNRSHPPAWMNGEHYGWLSTIAIQAENPDYVKEFYFDYDLDDHDRQLLMLFEKCHDPDYEYDWDKILRRVNHHWLDMDDLMLLPGLMRKTKAYERLEQRLHEKTRMIMDMEITPETDRENLLADFFYCSFSPALSSFFYAATRIECTARMSDVAFSIAAYRADHGDYPETLEQLVPKYLDRIPVSPYTEKPMRYLKRVNDVLLVNDETYQLDGSEAEVEKKIAEARDGDSVFLQARSLIIILHKKTK